MDILVCMKQVVEIETAKMTDDYRIDRAGSKKAVNPADCAALEHALALKEQYGGRVTVLTMGPDSAEEMLREVAPLNVDKLVLLQDKAAAGSDTLATARILAAAASHLGPFDLILAGRRAVDGETGHVPAEMAAMLGMPCVTNVVSVRGGEHVEEANPDREKAAFESYSYAMPDTEHDAAELAKLAYEANSVLCQRLLEDGTALLRVPRPAVISICGGANELRPPSIEGMRKAKEQEILKIDTKALGIDPGKIGMAGSPTKVKSLVMPEAPDRDKIRYDSAEEGAQAIYDALMDVSEKKRRTMSIAEVKEAKENQPEGYHGILVIEDEQANLLSGLELITHAVREGINPVCILAGPGSPEAENAVVRAGAAELDVLLTGEDPDDRYIAEAVAAFLKEREEDGSPFDSLVMGATVRGRAIGPMIGALLSLGVTADCTGIDYEEDGSLTQTRPTFGGTRLAQIETTTRPQIATVRPGIYADRTGLVSPSFLGTLMYVHPVRGKGRIQQLETTQGQASMLAEADVVLSGGKDIGEEGFALLMALREALEAKYEGRFSVAVGASRAAVDNGSIAYGAQVGLTGKVVHPQVYVAFAIEGAVQHLAGMKDSDQIIAVNTDRKAHIFDHADIGITCDWMETAKALLMKLRAE